MRILNFYILNAFSIRCGNKNTIIQAYAEAASVAVKDFGEVELLHFFFKSAWQTRIHCRTTRKHNVLVKFGSNINICCLYGAEKQFQILYMNLERVYAFELIPATLACHALAFHIYQVRLEQALGCFKSFRSHLYDTTVWQLRAILHQIQEYH